jgi:hypothetical protein
MTQERKVQKYEAVTQNEIMKSLDGKSKKQAARMYENYIKNPGTHKITIENFEKILVKRPDLFDFNKYEKKYDRSYDAQGNKKPFYGKSKWWKSDITGLTMDRTGWSKDEYYFERKLVQIPSSKHGKYLQTLGKDPNASPQRKRAAARVIAEMKRQDIFISEKRAAFHKNKSEQYRGQRANSKRDYSQYQFTYLDDVNSRKAIK